MLQAISFKEEEALSLPKQTILGNSTTVGSKFSLLAFAATRAARDSEIQCGDEEFEHLSRLLSQAEKAPEETTGTTNDARVREKPRKPARVSKSVSGSTERRPSARLQVDPALAPDRSGARVRDSFTAMGSKLDKLKEMFDNNETSSESRPTWVLSASVACFVSLMLGCAQ